MGSQTLTFLLGRGVNRNPAASDVTYCLNHIYAANTDGQRLLSGALMVVEAVLW